VVHTYLDGNEYEDIAASWDWNLIPGTTVDYDGTPLTCDKTGFTGLESFVGGVSDGHVGAAAIRYTNPYTKSLRWQKTWFFLEDDVQHIMISNVTSDNKSAPVFSVLDQRRHSQVIVVDGIDVEESRQTSSYPGTTSLWHGSVGYTFPISNGSFELSLRAGEQTGDWSAIGTSTQSSTTADLFVGWLEHKSVNDSVSYTVFPGVTYSQFTSKQSRRIQTLQNDAHISAAYDESHSTAMVVYWDVGGGSITFAPTPSDVSTTLYSPSNAVVIYNAIKGSVTVSDPTQKLSSLTLTITVGSRTNYLTFVLPKGGLAGSSISQNL
jgi:hypothetical protein